jgi:hypothetical protein
MLPQVARPALKVAGSRRPATMIAKGKGKQRAVDLPSKSTSTKRKAMAHSEEPDVKKRRGRTLGVANYSADDVDALLDMLEEHLPIGGIAWNNIGDMFSTWAKNNGRPSRAAKSLEAKFKQVCRFLHLLCMANFVGYSWSAPQSRQVMQSAHLM